MCFEKELFIYVYIRVYLQSTISELGIDIGHPFLCGMALNPFWKSALYVYMCILITVWKIIVYHYVTNNTTHSWKTGATAIQNDIHMNIINIAKHATISTSPCCYA